MNEYTDMLRAEIHATADEIRRLKRWWRTPLDERGEAPDTRFGLIASKWRATILCTLIAHHRGRLHRATTASLDAQGEMLRDVLDAEDRARHTVLLAVPLREAARAILAWRARPLPIPACVAPTEEHRA